MEYTFSSIKTDQKSLSEILSLLKFTFPKAKKNSQAFVRWQYAENPIGPMFGYNAYCDNELVAHYALMPIVAEFSGNKEKGLLSLNTATHPAHRGKKLFPKLAQKSYQSAREQGFGFVIGIANALSTPGFLRKLNFQFVGSLEAKIGVGRLKYKNVKPQTSFKVNWKSENLSWRLSNPSLSYQILNQEIICNTDYPFIKAIVTGQRKKLVREKELPNTKSGGLRLFLGNDPGIDWQKSHFFDIPKKWRPSPLNMIFKDLTGQERQLIFSEVMFEVLDFDAY